MDWDALGAIGEIIGAVAVVVTLAYLARQIRNQNRANDIAAYEGIADAFNQINLMLSADAELYRIFVTGLYEPSALNDEEAGRFSILYRAVMNNNHKIYRAHQRGAVEDDLWEKWAAEAADLIDSPGGRLYFEQQPESWDYVEALRRYKRDDSVIDFSLGRKGNAD